MSNKNNSVAVVFGAGFLLLVVGLGGYVLAQKAGLIDNGYHNRTTIVYDSVEEMQADIQADIARIKAEAAAESEAKGSPTE
ncbi:MAG: hypothetical protein G8D89_20620 [gamma proteobacterium symbiont of Clathrolucina costata]